jgi:hypothetical protein
MKKRGVSFLFVIFALGTSAALAVDQSAKVTEAVNRVEYGSKDSGKLNASVGTEIQNGEYLETEAQSRAALLLPSTSVTRLGSNTVFNYSVESNTIDLQEGTILFCKPKDASKLNIMTAAISAGITGTTGFLSIETGKGNHKTYILGIIEGHAVAHADDHPFPLGSGDILEFRPGEKPFVFSYDLPRFVKSTPLINKFKGTLPNQSYIDRALAEYEDDVSRGFIVPPSKAIDYSGDIPLLSNPAYDSALNAQGQSREAAGAGGPTSSGPVGVRNGNSPTGPFSSH